jgi:glycosyltransferase involved in cell wall biosynthesis
MSFPTQSTAAIGQTPLRVRLIGKANGVGLSRDFDLLAAALRACGCEVTLHACERRDRKRRRGFWTRLAARARALRRPPTGRRSSARYDINLMLEHVWPQFLHEAACNVLVPNPEWFDRRDLAFLGAATRVWAKTAIGERLFAQRGCRTVQIGFDSCDRYQADITRSPQFLHLAGRSPLKGTSRLLSLWQRHPQWPPLTVVQDGAVQPGEAAASAASNVVLHRGYLSDEALRQLQNSHRFHLCTSEAEGWGHYIAEAMSVGAVTLTCDAPPMNELIDCERGLLVAARSGERHNLATLCQFEDSALASAIERVLAMEPAQWDALGSAARAWFLHNKHGFAARVQRALDELAVAAPARARP